MSAGHKERDLAARPLPFLVIWGLPIGVLVLVNFLEGVLATTLLVLIVAAAFAWMGIACVINARRCRRLHCYVSGPVFLVGAAAIALFGLRVVDLGPDSATIASAVTGT